MPKSKENEVFTYRITPSGDGRFFVWRKFDVDGEEVEVGQQLFNSEADAEKAVRSFIDGNDVLAVKVMHSVNEDDNDHVVFETSQPEETTKLGAAIKYVDAAPQEEGDNDFRPTDNNTPTPAQVAVSEDTVAPEATEVEPTDAELKARAKAAEKKEKADAKAAKEAEASA